jgi:hypothetical protein
VRPTHPGADRRGDGHPDRAIPRASLPKPQSTTPAKTWRSHPISKDRPRGRAGRYPADDDRSQADRDAHEPWRLYAEAAALAVDADQLRGEADDLADRAQAHQARAERLRDRFERLARRLDPPPPPPTGE